MLPFTLLPPQTECEKCGANQAAVSELLASPSVKRTPVKGFFSPSRTPLSGVSVNQRKWFSSPKTLGTNIFDSPTPTPKCFSPVRGEAPCHSILPRDPRDCVSLNTSLF